MAAPQFVAAIDQGTTSTRCILFDVGSRIAAMAQEEHCQIYPRPGWVEHDPAEIWSTTQEVIRQAMAQAKVTAADIAAVGLANQRETLVIWDRRTGAPLCNAIVWSDTRTADICEQLAGQGGQDRFRKITGLPLASYFTGPKIRWALDNIPAVRRAADAGHAACGTIDSWLIWKLTGGQRHLTDVTNASRTMLMNLTTRHWDAEMLDALGVGREMLPEIVPSSHSSAYGTTSADGPFGGEIPIAGCLGDQQGALVGQTCFSPGELKNTYGTGCFMLLNTGSAPVFSSSGLITTVGYQFGEEPPSYALEGSVAVAGSLVQWLRDNLGLISRSADIEALARAAPDNGGVYIVPAFSGLFAPHWRADARGVVAGLTGYANKSHLARAVLEAAAYQTADVLAAMRRDCPTEIPSLRVDGGMAANELLMQFQADILGLPVVRSKIAETTALGAAYAAGLAVGFWPGADALRAAWSGDRAWQPAMPKATRRELLRGWHKAIDRSLGWTD